MTREIKQSILVTAIVLVAVALDQVLKIYVKTNFALGESYQITSWFWLSFVENEGMAFGIKWFSKLLLTLFRIAAVGVLGWYMHRLIYINKARSSFLSLVALITAGAIGNIIDCVFYGRIFSESTYTQVATLFPAGGGYANWLHGRVVDMFSFSIFPPIFNFADAAITVGVFYMLIFQWKWLKTL